MVLQQKLSAVALPLPFAELNSKAVSRRFYVTKHFRLHPFAFESRRAEESTWCASFLTIPRSFPLESFQYKVYIIHFRKYFIKM